MTCWLNKKFMITIRWIDPRNYTIQKLCLNNFSTNQKLIRTNNKCTTHKTASYPTSCTV